MTLRSLIARLTPHRRTAFSRPAGPLALAMATVALLALATETAAAQSFFSGGESRLRRSHSQRSPSADALRMLDIGRTYLLNDQAALGRTQREILIEQHPGTGEAEEARRLIARSLERAAAERAPAPAVKPVVAPAQRRLNALDEELRLTAGDRIFFPEASADLGTKARVALGAQARWLKRHANLSVVVEGHADDRGDRGFNAELAKRRADAVRARLGEEGVEDARIATVVYGKDQPVATCTSGECTAQNRRVVTRVDDPARTRAQKPPVPAATPAGLNSWRRE